MTRNEAAAIVAEWANSVSKTGLARRLGLTRNAVQQWGRGQAVPSTPERLRALAEAAGGIDALPGVERALWGES